MASLLKFEFGNATDVGRVRTANEDYMSYFESPNGHVFIVCDGMGGHVGGARASTLAVECLRDFFEQEKITDCQKGLKEAIDYANQQVYQTAKAEPQLQGMGTTVVIVLIKEEKVYYAHVGDSRIYLFTKKELHRLTVDQSLVQQMLSNGILTEDEAKTHPKRNIITQALGTKATVEAVVTQSPLCPANNDMLLICSDGLTEMVKETDIYAVMSNKESMQYKALRLVEMANAAGGTDNITVQLIRFTESNHPKTDFISLSDKPIKIATKKNLLTNRKTIIIAAFTVFMLLCFVLAYRLIWVDNKQEPDNKEQSDTSAAVVIHKDDNSQQTDSLKQIDTVINLKVEEKLYKEDIIKRFNLTDDIFLKHNIIKKPEKSLKGEVLKIPLRALHRVEKDESLHSIAQKYKVGQDHIMKANDMKEPKINLGDTIYIPLP